MGKETGKTFKSRKDRNIGQIVTSGYSKSKSSIYCLQLYWCAHFQTKTPGLEMYRNRAQTLHTPHDLIYGRDGNSQSAKTTWSSRAWSLFMPLKIMLAIYSSLDCILSDSDGGRKKFRYSFKRLIQGEKWRNTSGKETQAFGKQNFYSQQICPLKQV